MSARKCKILQNGDSRVDLRSNAQPISNLQGVRTKGCALFPRPVEDSLMFIYLSLFFYVTTRTGSSTGPDVLYTQSVDSGIC